MCLRRPRSLATGCWSIVLAATVGAAARVPPAGSPPPVEAIALDSATAVRLDGELNDAVWQSAPPVTEFIQREPHEGQRASFPTEARVAYDAASLYVAVRAFDPDPGELAALLTRRDENSPSDWIRVIVDSYHDRRSAYEFAVNPVGVKQDSYRYNDQNEDRSWDAIWDVVVSRDAESWKAEFRIPFSQLRFDPDGAGTFGFAVVRHIARLSEIATWPLLPRSANGYVSSFGELTGLKLGRSVKRLELVPYAVGQIKTQPEEDGNPLVDSPDPDASPGIDLKFAVTPGLTLSGTVNPDFGQVEADPAEVNLSAFETFFAERRPFFVEGSGIFKFDLDCSDGNCSGLFYSRRIGRTPQGDPDEPDDGYTWSPAQTTILGAAKITGRAGGFSIGALNAITAEETGLIADANGVVTQQAVEPPTSYTVLRLRREFTNQSSLGFMTTATNRWLSPDVDFLAREAYTGGVDWDWRFGPRYGLSGYWAGSSLYGSPAAMTRLQESNVHLFQRPDATHIELDETRTSLAGHGGMLSFSKIGGERVRFNTNVNFKSPGFDINDLGFQRRADQRSMGNWVQIRWDTPRGVLRMFRLNFNQWAAWNYDGDRLFGGGNINAHATFTSNWRTGAGLNFGPGGFDDRLTRGGPGGRTNARPGLWHYVESDDRKPISFGYNIFLSRDQYDSSHVSLSPEFTVRPTSAFWFSTGLRYNHGIEDSQWVEKVTEDGVDHYVLGHLDQTTVSFQARVNYTITPNLSLQLYMEPFVSAADYSSFKELVNGRADVYADRYAPFDYQENPDFNFKSLRATNVLRWEYKPGSTLFVVWQQNRSEETEDIGDFQFGRDFGDVFGVPGTNVFLVKLAYWLNY
jgi:hypothetical protein